METKSDYPRNSQAFYEGSLSTETSAQAKVKMDTSRRQSRGQEDLGAEDLLCDISVCSSVRGEEEEGAESCLPEAQSGGDRGLCRGRSEEGVLTLAILRTEWLLRQRPQTVQ